jgi:rubredoxin
MDKYVCDVCGWIYDPATGCEEKNIKAGTSFEDIPSDFECPVCGADKSQFSKIEK